MGCSLTTQPFDFCAHPDHDPDFRNFDGIFTTAYSGFCKNFLGSAALAEVCGFQVLLVIIIIIVVIIIIIITHYDRAALGWYEALPLYGG